MNQEPAERYIGASEVGQYAFCPRAWWLEVVEGLPSAHRKEMEAGTRAHRAHGRRVHASTLLAYAGLALLALALFLALLVLLR